MPPTKLDLAELRRKVEAMTPTGEWLADGEMLRLESEVERPIGYMDGGKISTFAEDCNNAVGIVAVRNAAPQLLAIAEAAQEYGTLMDAGDIRALAAYDALRKALGVTSESAAERRLPARAEGSEKTE